MINGGEPGAMFHANPVRRQVNVLCAFSYRGSAIAFPITECLGLLTYGNPPCLVLGTHAGTRHSEREQVAARRPRIRDGPSFRGWRQNLGSIRGAERPPGLQLLLPLEGEQLRHF
jgi:hypothetical protein